MKSPSIASIALPALAAVSCIVGGDYKAIVPLAIILPMACLIRFAGVRRALSFTKALIVAVLIWVAAFLIEQGFNPEMAAYRMAGGSVPAVISTVPYAGPIVVLLGNFEQSRRDRKSEITFENRSPLKEKISLDGMGLMLAFLFGLLRWSRKSAVTV